MTSEHFTGCQAGPDTSGLTFDTTVAIVEGLLNDPECFERTRKVIEALETTDPGLFTIFADGTEGLSTSSADPPALPIAIQAVLDNPTVKLSKDGTGITVHDGRRRKHMCLLCGKLYDKKPRADDCRSRHLGIRPHVCRGRCGNKNCDKSYALEELLTRHWEPKASRYIKCTECDAKVPKHNRTRHMKSCLRRSKV